MSTTAVARRPFSSTASIVSMGLGLMLVSAVGTAAVLPFIVARPAMIPVAILGCAFGAFLLLRPEWILPVFLSVTYASVGSSFFGGLPSPIEAGGAAFLALAAWRALSRPALARDAVLLCVVLALPLIASALLHPGSLGEIYDLIKRLLFLPIAALCLRSRADVERTIVALATLGLILGVGAAWSVLVGPTALFPVSEAEGSEAARAAGPFGEPTFFALSLAVLVPLALSLILRGGAVRWLGYASTLALTAGAIAAGSRGAVVAIVLSVVLLAFGREGRRVRVAALVVLLGGAALIPVFADQASSSAQRTVSGRATENLVAVEMFLEHPLLGVGPGEYQTLYRDYSRRVGDDARYERWAHSLPLEIAAEQGAVGLIAWLTALLLVVRTVVVTGVWRTWAGKGLVVALVVFGFESMFQHGSQLRILYVLIGALLALAWTTERKEVTA
jgi:O-antigen ligase